MFVPKTWRRFAVALASAAVWTVTSTAVMASPLECLPTQPIDCSTGWLNLLRPIAVAAVVFEDDCLGHDLCYLHGATTYGYDKARCDDEFFAALDTMCRSEIRPIDFATLGLTRVFCNIAKRGMYAAVSRTGLAEDAFKDAAQGTCCRYDENGIPLPECAV